MGAVENLQLLLSAQTTGTDEINKLVESINRLAQSTNAAAKGAESSSSSFEHFAERVKGAIEDPLGAASSAAKGLLTALGPVGAGVAAATGVFATAATVGFEWAKQLGEMGTQIQSTAIRLGMTTKEVGQFSFAAQAAGGDIGMFETAVKKLSQGLADGSEEGKKAREALEKLGIRTTDLEGDVRPIPDIFRQLGDAFAHMQSAAQRNAAAVDILGRSGISLIPTLVSLNENLRLAEEHGFGKDEATVRRLEEYHQRVLVIEKTWDRIVFKVKDWAATLALGLTEGATHDKLAERGFWGGYRSMTGAGSFTSDWIGDQARWQAQRTHDLMIASDPRVASIQQAWSTRYDSTSAGLHSQLATAEKAAEEARRAFLSYRGVDYDRALGLEKAADQASAKVAALKAQIDGLKGSDQASTALKAFADSVERVNSDPLQKLTERYRSLVETLKRDHAGKSVFAEAQRIYDAAALDLVYTSTRQKQAMRGDLLPSGIPLEVLAGSAEQFEFAERMQKAQAEAYDKSASFLPAPHIPGVLGDPNWLEKSGEAMRRNLDLARQEADFQARRLELLAGPGGEIDAIRQVTQLKLASLERQRTLGAEEFELEKERNRILQDEQLRILEVQKQREASLRQTAGSLFDAITASGGGLSSYLKGFGLGQARSVFENSYAMLFGGTQGKFSLTRDPQSTLGKLVQNTMFGASDKAANTQLIAAGMQQDAARTMLSATTGLSARGGFGSVAFGGGLNALSMPGAGIDTVLAQLGHMPAGMGGGSLEDQIAALPTLDTSRYLMYMKPESLSSTSKQAMKAMGYVTGATAAAYGIYSGIRAGGAQGALTAAGSGLCAAAMIPGPQQPFLAAAALLTGVASSLLGDPHQRRANELSNEAERRKFTEPTGTDYVSDIYGRKLDFNKLGQVRINLTMQVNALDSKSIIDNQEVIGEAVRQAFTSYPPLATSARSAILPE